MTALAACWWDPQFGHSFGQRAFMDIYPLLMPALAAGVAAVLSWRHGWVWMGFVGGAGLAVGAAHFLLYNLRLVPPVNNTWTDYIAGWRKLIACFF